MLVGNSSVGSCKKLLEVKIDSKLSFDDHVKDIQEKANKKLSALARAEPYLKNERKQLLVNIFFGSHFNCCPLTWMLHSRRNNNILDHLKKTFLRLIYTDKSSAYDEFLIKDISDSIRHGNIQNLAIEMSIVKSDLSLKIVNDTFLQQAETQYNLRHHNDFRTSAIGSVFYGSKSISLLGPKI